MITGIIAFFQMLPRLIELLNRLGNYMIKNDLENWMNDLEASIDNLEKADDAQKKLDAAHQLAVVISRLG